MIFDAQLGRWPSYVWMSIWFARELLKEGLLWRVGNVGQIRIWKEKWLPRAITHHDLTPRGGLSDDARVENLIDWETKGWNINMVHKLFGEDNAAVIWNPKSLLVLTGDHSNGKQIWSATTNREFTVRSADHLQKERLSTDLEDEYYSCGEGVYVEGMPWCIGYQSKYL